MTPERLNEILERLGAVAVEGELLAPCPLHQPDCTEPHRYKLVLSPGYKRFLCAYCRVCMDDCGWAGRFQRAAGIGIGELNADCAEEIDDCWRGIASKHRGGVNYGLRSHSPRPVLLTDPDLNAVYTDLLQMLVLSDRHAKWLEKRGLTDAAAFGYRSGCGGSVRTEIGELLYAKWGASVLHRVPGFADGKLLLRDSCILTPVRNSVGEVVALKQRILDGGTARMRWLGGGVGARNSARCHCPLGVGGRRWERLWVTEGERKADVHWRLTGKGTVGIPGAGSRRCLFPVLDDLLTADGVVVVALDRDSTGVENGERLAGELVRTGRRVEVAEWGEGKGIDDAVLKGVEITVREWEGETKKPIHPTPVLAQPSPTFPRLGDRVYDEFLLPYLRRYGPQLRDEIKCYQVGLSERIKSGEVLMLKSRKGQVVAVRGQDVELRAKVREVNGG